MTNLSLSLNCIVFTLEGKEVSQNRYIHIFLIWLANLIKFAELKENDFVRVFMDGDTKEYMETHTPFFLLMQKLPCKFQVLVIPRPKSALEGMMWKYYFVDYTQDVYMYCDIDCMTIAPVHQLTDALHENTIAVQQEGTLDHDNYGAAFTLDHKDALKDFAGLSAGKFIVRGKELVQQIFAKIFSLQKEWTGADLYTVEQPFFNKAIYLLNQSNINFNLMNDTNISPNGNRYEKGKTVLMDFMGEPGNGEFHLKKILELLVLFYTDIW